MVPKGRFIQPGIAAKIAFVMEADLVGVGVSRADVIGATVAVCPSLEVLDTRILRMGPALGKAGTIVDTISDNTANAGVVLGSVLHDPVKGLRRVGAILTRDGVVEETGLGVGVLDDPVSGIVGLVQRLARYGQGLSKGDIVRSGSFTRPVEVPSGSRF